MAKIAASELILNPNGSIYHLNLHPEHIADTIITVGDQDRVSMVTKHFDTIEFSVQNVSLKQKLVYIKAKELRLSLRVLDRIILI